MMCFCYAGITIQCSRRKETSFLNNHLCL